MTRTQASGHNYSPALRGKKGRYRVRKGFLPPVRVACRTGEKAYGKKQPITVNEVNTTMPHPNPSAIADTAKVLLTVKEVAVMTGLSRSSILNKLNPDSIYHDAIFPQKIRISRNRVAWDKNKIFTWIEQQKTLRQG